MFEITPLIYNAIFYMYYSVMNKHEKKVSQLGMNPGTASYILVKDILFSIISENGIVCFHCNLPLTRDTFSIEHKVPWLDSENPRGMFFDLRNISYSHLSCNSKASRKRSVECSDRKTAKRFCKCEYCILNRATFQNKKREEYCSEKRSAQYKRTGK